MANNANDVLAIAAAEIGYSRWNDPEAGTKYGRWYEQSIDQCSTNYDYGASGVPFCAMFDSWVFDQAGAVKAGLPGAYCPSILSTAKKAGKVISAASAQPGDNVLFDWDGDGTADHIGIVELNTGSYLQTIEGNTNNGCVARRTRAYSTVIGIIRPDFDGTTTPTSTTTTTTTTTASATSGGSDIVKQGQRALEAAGYSVGSCGIDGEYGTDTKAACIRYVQAVLGVSVDGIDGSKTKAAFAANGLVKKGSTGAIVKAVQIALLCHGYSVGSCGIDGEFGSDTRSAVCSFQTAKGLSVDGIVGKNTFAALF